MSDGSEMVMIFEERVRQQRQVQCFGVYLFLMVDHRLVRLEQTLDGSDHGLHQ